MLSCQGEQSVFLFLFRNPECQNGNGNKHAEAKDVTTSKPATGVALRQWRELTDLRDMAHLSDVNLVTLLVFTG
jgi:hypothetical protein